MPTGKSSETVLSSKQTLLKGQVTQVQNCNDTIDPTLVWLLASQTVTVNIFGKNTYRWASGKWNQISYVVHSIPHIYRTLQWMVKLPVHVWRDRLDLRHSKAGAQEQENNISPIYFFLILVTYLLYNPSTNFLHTWNSLVRHSALWGLLSILLNPLHWGLRGSN